MFILLLKFGVDFSLMLQKPLLPWQAPSIARETSIGADHAMAGDDDSNPVVPIGACNGPDGLRLTKANGQLLVGAGRSKWDFS